MKASLQPEALRRLDQVRALLDRLDLQSDAVVRKALATELVEVLIAMRQPGYEPQEALLLNQLLEEGRIVEVADNAGRCCRAEAVKTLLACGYPHALAADADDVAHARRYQAAHVVVAPADWDDTTARERARTAYLMAVGQLAHLVTLFVYARNTPGWAIASAMLGLGALAASLWAATRDPRTVNLALLGTGYVFALLGLLACALVVGIPSLVGAGTVALALRQLFKGQYSRRADPATRGDWDYVPSADGDSD